MAWTSDTIWCDPKFADVTDTAFRAYINANSYSSGFLLRGHLTAGQLKTIGAGTKAKRDLVGARLWHDDGNGGIDINDWEEHNSKRDDRRAKDRERKRAERQSDPDGWITRSAKWQTTRQAVFERDNGFCVDCNEQTEGWHADHVPDRKTLRHQGLDPFSLNFIETRCHPCHARKHSLERHRRTRGEVGTDERTDTDKQEGQRQRPARGEGSEGSEGSEELQKELSKAVPVARHDARGEPTERPQIASTIRTLIDASLKEHAA